MSSEAVCKIMKRKLLFVFAVVLCSVNLARAQAAPEITVSFSEQFLNRFLDAVFANLDTPKFELAKKPKKSVNYQKTASSKNKCDESVTLLREANGIKTAIRFVDNKIIAPIAFTGVYDVPFVGCSNFRGVAEANLNLEYNREQQILFGRVKVGKVDLNGVPAIASGVVGKIVQSSIDKRVNPLEILRAEQLAATVPVQYANGSIKLRAVDMKPEIAGSNLNVRVAFEFAKAQ